MGRRRFGGGGGDDIVSEGARSRGRRRGGRCARSIAPSTEIDRDSCRGLSTSSWRGTNSPCENARRARGEARVRSPRADPTPIADGKTRSKYEPGCRRDRSRPGTWSRPCRGRARCLAGRPRCPRPCLSSGTSAPSCRCPCRAGSGRSRAGAWRPCRRRRSERGKRSARGDRQRARWRGGRFRRRAGFVVFASVGKKTTKAGRDRRAENATSRARDRVNVSHLGDRGDHGAHGDGGHRARAEQGGTCVRAECSGLRDRPRNDCWCFALSLSAIC